MPDLLTHVFLAYAILRVISWRYDWITSPYVTTGMAGAVIPDLAKVSQILPNETMETVLSIPFSWGALQTPIGVAFVVLIGGFLVDGTRRMKVLLVLSLGAALHLIADALLIKASGRTVAVLWPLSRWRPTAPGLYLSTQPEPTVITGAFALIVWVASIWQNR